jgi:hypothetical protein
VRVRRFVTVALGAILGTLALRWPAAADSAPCRWIANPPYVQVKSGSRVPLLATAVRGTAIDPTAVPAYTWNPDLVRRGRVRIAADGTVSSIVTVAGGGCTPVRVAVLVYSDGYVPQRSVALDFGDSQAHDEFDSGRGSFETLASHAEIGDPFGLYRTWLSADLRSIAYLHRAGTVENVGDSEMQEQPTFGVRDTSLEIRAGKTVIKGGLVADLTFMTAGSNTPRPGVSGFGIGIEVPPTLQQTLSAYGALSYYPNLTGGGVRYRAVRFRTGGTLSLLPFFGYPYYLDLAAVGDRRSDASRAPGAVRFQGIVFGLGYRFGSRL